MGDRRVSSRRVAGAKRTQGDRGPRTSAASRTDGWNKPLVGAISAICVAVVIAWVTPVGPRLWSLMFPGPTLTASVVFPDGECGSFVVPTSSEAATTDVDFGTAEWAARNDAAQASPYAPDQGTSKVLFTITGYEDRPVTITGLTIRTNIQSEKPATGEHLSLNCGDATIARYAEVDLDARPPRVTGSSSTEITWGDMVTSPLRFPYDVDSRDTESLLLIASTGGYVEWSAVVDWSDGRSSGRLIIDNDGEPFRTVVSPTW